MNDEPLTQDDENLLTRDDHEKLAHKLSGLRALTGVQRDRNAPMRAALKHAVRLVEALQAGLSHDYMSCRSDIPPYLAEGLARPLGHAFARMVSDAREIDRLIAAKATRDCVVAVAHDLVMAIERVQADEVIPTVRDAESPPRNEYQQAIEHLAALGTFLQVLHHTAFIPADGSVWRLPPEECAKLGYLEGMPAALGMIEFWATSCIDELMSGQVAVLRLFFLLKQHALSGGCVFDLERMDQTRRNWQARNQVDPDSDLSTLVPVARAIQAILTQRAPCRCISNAARDVVETMETLRDKWQAPRPQAH
jgi:hypothetical protein